MMPNAARLFLIAIFLLASGLPARSLGAGPIISEFMALNDTTLQDEDLDYPDWIEIYNPDPTPANLNGWHLTDDSAILAKWTFPAVTLPAGGYLVVFASGKDRRDPARQLHTNFHLDSEVGYLALVTPGGQVAFDFGTVYPPQVSDYSYGVSQGATLDNLVISGAPAKTIIPGATLGLGWTQISFVDDSWTSGLTGIGYDRETNYVPLISTNVRPAMDGINTTAYIRIPFTVTGAAKIKGLFFRMKYDDGFIAYLNGTKVASKNDPASPDWNSAATAKHDDTLAVIFEEIDISQYAGLLREGPNVLAIHGMNSDLQSSDFLILPELDGVGEGEFHPEVKEYFPRPSPGFANLPGYPGVTEKPQYSISSQVFSGTLSVELATVASGAVIRTTSDGSEPTGSSPIYSNPLSLTKTTVVRARAFEGNLAPSPLASETYLRIAPALVNFDSNLPIMIIDTAGQGINDNAFIAGFGAVMEPGTDGRSRMSAEPTFSGPVAVHYRGSSSAGFPKRSMNLETRDERGKDRKVHLAGFSEESDWILYGPYTDKTLVRDYLSYLWSNKIGRYAPRGKLVELYLNTSGGDVSQASYVGVYNLFEKIKLDDARVDLHKMHPSDTTEPDITGGYILKKDRIDPDEQSITTSLGHLLVFVEPSEGEIAPQQRTYIQTFFNDFEAALMGANFKDPVNGYAKYIDVDSFIDHHILVETMKNIDGYRLSTFMYKDRGKKLNMGPIWDYNLTLGNANYLEGWKPEGWYYTQVGGGDYPWYGRLFQDPDFLQRYADRWALHRRNAFQTQLLMADIDAAVSVLGEAEPRDHTKWPVLGTYVWPNPQPVPQTYSQEISVMKNWLSSRLTWIDSNYPIPPSFSQNGGPITPGFILTITGTKVYYTLDGTDPRRPGGSLNPSAVLYSAPIILNQNTRVIARAQPAASRWSAPLDAAFVVTTPPLVITEIMYHPEPPPVGSPFDTEDFEFVELKNMGSGPLNISGFHIGGGIDFTFPAGLPALGTGELVVVSDSLLAFAARYPEVSGQVVGEYSGHLSNSGDPLVLEGPLREPILSFSYADTWYPETDGAGRSLVLVDPATPLSAFGDASRWSASRDAGGSPGADDGSSPSRGRQLIGDGNQDGALDLSDALNLVLQLFDSGSAVLPCSGDSLRSGGNSVLYDLNGDHSVNLADVVFMLNYLFRGGREPALGTSCVPIVGCPDKCGG